MIHFPIFILMTTAGKVCSVVPGYACHNLVLNNNAFRSWVNARAYNIWWNNRGFWLFPIDLQQRIKLSTKQSIHFTQVHPLFMGCMFHRFFLKSILHRIYFQSCSGVYFKQLALNISEILWVACTSLIDTILSPGTNNKVDVMQGNLYLLTTWLFYENTFQSTTVSTRIQYHDRSMTCNFKLME